MVTPRVRARNEEEEEDDDDDVDMKKKKEKLESLIAIRCVHLMAEQRRISSRTD